MELDVPVAHKSLQYFYICQVTYKTSINLTKCSILLLFTRIFGNIRWFKYLALLLMTVVAMYGISSVTATIFQCTPVPRAFNKSISGTCIDNEKFWYANAGFSVATDVIILCMPMPLVRQLQIPRVQKVALIVVFALGGFVVITSCLRMTTINLAAVTPDTTYDITSTMWTVIEMNIAIVCACLPMIRPLIVRLFPKLMPKSSSLNKTHVYANSSSYGHGAKGYNISSHSRNDNVAHEWARIEAKDGITLTSIRKGGDQSSEEYILQEDKPEAGSSSVDSTGRASVLGPNINRAIGIQKTVQYTVEYSKQNPHPQDFA
jgi:hypothetical protein